MTKLFMKDLNLFFFAQFRILRTDFPDWELSIESWSKMLIIMKY